MIHITDRLVIYPLFNTPDYYYEYTGSTTASLKRLPTSPRQPSENNSTHVPQLCWFHRSEATLISALLTFTYVPLTAVPLNSGARQNDQAPSTHWVLTLIAQVRFILLRGRHLRNDNISSLWNVDCRETQPIKKSLICVRAWLKVNICDVGVRTQTLSDVTNCFVHSDRNNYMSTGSYFVKEGLQNSYYMWTFSEQKQL